jgi:hypothetical protein
MTFKQEVYKGCRDLCRRASIWSWQIFSPALPFTARKKDGLVALYPTLEKYEWDVSYTLACRRLPQQKG